MDESNIEKQLFLLQDHTRVKYNTWASLKSDEGYSTYKTLHELGLIGGKTFDRDFYDKAIQKMIARDEESQATSLSEIADNTTEVPTDAKSSWILYKRNVLANKQRWSVASIDNLENSTASVLKKLSTDSNTAKVKKGLVVGNVQSGKTANMTGLIAMAADNGFNTFIVLSGMIEKLREQNANRIFGDLNQGEGDNLWQNISQPNVKDKVALEQRKFGKNSHNRYLIVSLKNKNRLDDLKRWLDYDQNQKKQMRVLLIDDEADQASINTQDIESGKQTTINRIIREIVNDDDFGAMNYVAYTATPFANVLNESGNDSLYPRDFITILNPAANYIGAHQIMGTPDPNYSRGLEIIREISEHDRREISDIQKNNTKRELPGSFKEAINWFLLAVSIMRANGYRKPVSMMVHTDFKVESHRIIEGRISEYLNQLKRDFPKNIKMFKDQYDRETKSLTVEDFKQVMPDYEGEVRDYPAWDQVKQQLVELFEQPEEKFVTHISQNEESGKQIYGKGIHLCVDNSNVKDDTNEIHRLIYPTKHDEVNTLAPAFVVVGGSTLSRGLTIEGLVSTFFLRNTNQADTLMQMGRWFGFRIGYELIPRIWLDNTAYARYRFLREMNDEMLDQWKQFAESGMTPREIAPKIKTSPSFNMVRVTSENKMQSAHATDFDFAGLNTQIVLFDTTKEVIDSNLAVTKKFLNSLEGKARINGHSMVWYNVDNEKVTDYLSEYQQVKQDRKVNSIPNILKWINKNLEEEKQFNSWNVVYSGLGQPVDASDDDEWNIQGKTIAPVRRTRRKLDLPTSTPNVISIGALRSPIDLVADASEEKLNELKKDRVTLTGKIIQVAKIRREGGVAENPQLIIYRIDKDSKNTGDSPLREDLNVENDLIGLNIMFPARNGSNGNHVKYVAVRLDLNEPLDDGGFVDEGYWDEEEE